ncbi:hypothetical protein BDU57DRAFT_543167 [Ampelomyces quisqualis]|uniref:Uncharacterized protein n=1 Tax=Ampelomyces quisqualis TaxID=50730 RepID=A0A6A5Q978_AMPQU|nr:hypothetical protein BDU57DRAFT_543167 [Ampelomyces quisqualis]
MSTAPLAQSADKQVLFARLGLNEQIHKSLLEAQDTRDSLSRNPLNLTDQSKANPFTRTPYKWDEISETAKHRETLTMVNNAPPHTKYYYAMGRYQTNVNEENWVARWYLWHSFRYRDNRDTRSRATTGAGNGGYGGNTLLDLAVHRGSSTYGGGSGASGSAYFDPVYNTYR